MSSNAPKFGPDSVGDDRHDTDLSDLEPDFGIYEPSSSDAPWENPNLFGQVDAADRAHASFRPPPVPAECGSGVHPITEKPCVHDGTNIEGIVPQMDDEDEVTEEFTGRMNVADFPPELRAVVASSRMGCGEVLDADGEESPDSGEE
jgi:hypothetical protein